MLCLRQLTLNIDQHFRPSCCSLQLLVFSNEATFPTAGQTNLALWKYQKNIHLKDDAVLLRCL